MTWKTRSGNRDWRQLWLVAATAVSFGLAADPAVAQATAGHEVVTTGPCQATIIGSGDQSRAAAACD